MTQGTTSYIEMLRKFGDNLGLLAEAGRRQADRSPEEKHREVQVDFLVVRRQDCAAKIVKGGDEARLADDLMVETGLEQDWNNVMKNLSGQWRQRLKGFAISESGDHVATDG